jgi:hypothetical protein
MNEIEYQRERRKQRALERLGTNTPKCIYCPEDDWRCLESHHIAGRAFDDLTMIVCRNHHRKLSDKSKDHPPTVCEPPDQLDCIGHFLLGLADLFELLIAKLREFGQALIARARPTEATP